MGGKHKTKVALGHLGGTLLLILITIAIGAGMIAGGLASPYWYVAVVGGVLLPIALIAETVSLVISIYRFYQLHTLQTFKKARKMQGLPKHVVYVESSQMPVPKMAMMNVHAQAFAAEPVILHGGGGVAPPSAIVAGGSGTGPTSASCAPPREAVVVMQQ